jgi:hypothetical protein
VLILVALAANTAVDLMRPRAMLPLPGSVLRRETDKP